MSIWSTRGWLRGLTAGLLAGSIAVLGCGKKADPEETSSGESAVGSPEAPAASTNKADAAPVVRDGQHQAFLDAVRNADNPPEGADRPPDETMTNKKIHRILDQVKESWDTIRFRAGAGKKVAYTAELQTNRGIMQIALFPDVAPNHVRNFIALARAGYYDQLRFERAVHEQDPMTNQEIHMLEAGCPLGTGETVTGSIGYWLKQELTPPEKMSHEEGTVGACRGEDPDTAASRFYINLTPAPFLDGNYTIFGKVVQGLDVLRKMATEPVEIDEEGVGHPRDSIVIEKVTILAQEVEAEKK